MKIVGLTGGIACGKSSVTRLFIQRYQLPVIDADDVAHRIIEPGTKTYFRVVKAFGQVNDIFQDDQKGVTNPPIDRKKLGAIVFGDDQARRKLGSLMNSAIAWRMMFMLASLFLKGSPLVILDVPLLFETGMHRICHSVVVVSTTPEVQLQRLLARDGAGEADARARIASQKMTAADKAKRADVILENSGDLSKLEMQLMNAYPSIKKTSLVHKVLSRWPFFLIGCLLLSAFVSKILPSSQQNEL
mmetsp:Transcript_4700/g.8060  ORF Transcript_4700/g.8060 Transcript_4700/m.8060 type:complete len:245 (-) Transcript_4700:42-776(-)